MRLGHLTDQINVTENMNSLTVYPQADLTFNDSDTELFLSDKTTTI